LVFNLDIVVAVIGLLNTSCPAAVRWLVATVSINAVQAVVFGWPAPHIGKEVFVNKPTLANGYAATAIIVVLSAERPFASLNHTIPNLVFITIMSDVFGTPDFNRATPAALSFSASQRIASNNLFCSAIAATKPVRTFAVSAFGNAYSGITQNKIAIKPLSREVYSAFGKCWCRMLLSHDTVLLDRTVKWLEPCADSQSARGSFYYSNICRLVHSISGKNPAEVCHL